MCAAACPFSPFSHLRWGFMLKKKKKGVKKTTINTIWCSCCLDWSPPAGDLVCWRGFGLNPIKQVHFVAKHQATAWSLLWLYTPAYPPLPKNIHISFFSECIPWRLECRVSWNSFLNVKQWINIIGKKNWKCQCSSAVIIHLSRVATALIWQRLELYLTYYCYF